MIPPRPSHATNASCVRYAVHRVGVTDPVTAMAYFTIPDGTAGRPSYEYLQQIIDGATSTVCLRAWIAALERLATL